MQAAEIVERLVESEGEVIEVEDREGKVWRAYVDNVDYTPLQDGKYDPEGVLEVALDMTDEQWDESPTEGFAPSILSSEERGEWGRPWASYHAGEDEYWSADVERVDVAGDG